MADQVQTTAIGVDSLSKVFKLPHEKTTTLKSALINFRKRRTYEKQQVLKDISFDVKEGEFFGIVGRNGSGKSTLLKLLAGIYVPTEGSIHIHGKLTPFIELGVGFNMELTGRENIFLNGSLLGFNRKEMQAMYRDIVNFAELHNFMDQKLKNYSSGMQVRLAFSIAIRANSDILLIDEVLAVGDALFQKKCLNYFKELKKNKKTVILVSHDSNILQEYCDKGILIEKGNIVSKGPIGKVVRDYIDILNAQEEKEGLKNEEDKGTIKKDKDEWGTGDIKIASLETFNPGSGKPQTVFTQDDPIIGLKVKYKAVKASASPVYGITVSDIAGQRIFQSNTLWSKIETKPVKAKETTEISWEIPNIFNSGDFSVAPAVADHYGSEIYNWKEDALRFKVRKELQSTGFTNVEHVIKVKDAKIGQ